MQLSEVLHPAPDPERPHPAFTLVTARALAYALHSDVARAQHDGVPRCPDHDPWVLIAGVRWYATCTDCAQFFDDELARRYRRFLKILRRAETGSLSPDEEVLISYLRSKEASRVTVEEAADLLLAEAKRRKTKRSGQVVAWEAAWQRLLIARPPRQVSADARRSRAAREGRAARPDRDLRDARWAAPLHDDPVGLEILISFVIGLRDRAADPWTIPPEHAGGLQQREVDRRLGAMLVRLQALRPDWHNANILEPLAQRGTVRVPADEIDSLPGVRPLWENGGAPVITPPAGAVFGRLPISAGAGAGTVAAASFLLPLVAQTDVTGILTTAIRSLPVIIVVLLSFPAWLVMPFVSKPRRDSILAELHRIQEWHSRVSGPGRPFAQRGGPDDGDPQLAP